MGLVQMISWSVPFLGGFRPIFQESTCETMAPNRLATPWSCIGADGNTGPVRTAKASPWQQTRNPEDLSKRDMFSKIDTNI